MEAPPSHAVYTNRGGTLPRLPPKPRVREVSPGDAFTVDDIRVRSGLARHVQPYLECNAYRITSGSSSVVYTGDTEPCSEVVDLARGADLLISMCWDEEAVMIENGEATGQTGSMGAARMARDADVGTLLLTHIGPNISHGIDDEEMEAMACIYSGVILQAVEGIGLELSGGQVREQGA